jgi:Tol biopolymer transport system component
MIARVALRAGCFVAASQLVIFLAARIIGAGLSSGGEIAFVRAHVHGSEIQRELRVLDIDRGLSCVLYYGGLNVGAPAWSPDGQQLAFIAASDQAAQLYVMNADGSSLHPVTDSPTDKFSVIWSPDGRNLAFTSLVENTGAIFAMNTNGKQLRHLTGDPKASALVWLKNRNRILFLSGSNRDGAQIFSIDADNGQSQLLKGNFYVDLRLPMAWSPDGKQIVFASIRHGHYDIYTTGADDSTLSQLTNDPAIDFSPTWSSNGRWIIFATNEGDDYAMMTMDANGSNRRRLIGDVDPFGGFSWRS